MQLTNKKILVTGATGGIGSALCKLLDQEGARLLMTCYDQELLQKLAGELSAGHETIVADISSQQGRDKIIAAAQDIDGMVNLAGILDFRMFQNQPPALVEKTFSINTLAPILLCQALIPAMLKKPEAMILNVGSVFASIGHPGFAVYCASKGALKSFSEALSRELADTSLHISYIAPRATTTALNSDRINAMNEALGNRSDSPQYVAGEIVMQLKKGNTNRCLGWPEKLFVRVNALFPSIVHKALVKKLPVIKQYANS